MSTDDLKFEDLPQAVAHLIKEVNFIKEHVTKSPQHEPQDERVRMNVEEVCKFLGKAKPTIYTLVRSGVIPSYKDNKCLFFFKDELVAYQNSCKKTTPQQLREQVDKERSQPNTQRPTRRY